jgi:hypothetical protein
MSPTYGRTSARRALAAVAVLSLGLPGRAAACAVCLGSAFGDRAYSWPYIGLILLPFLVGAAVLGVLAWHAGWRPRMRRAAPADPSPSTHTETT